MSRVRTESMIQRLAKKPLSEGFELWDKDYLLGALRLFQCKLEASPPFEVAPILEAIATLLATLDECEDAVEHFVLAADKYDLIQKKHMAALMQAKAAELKEGLEEAVKLVNEAIASGNEEGNAKEKMQLGCLYTYRADLHGVCFLFGSFDLSWLGLVLHPHHTRTAHPQKSDNFAEGVKDCDKALELCPGRLVADDVRYITQHQKGQLLLMLNDAAAAENAFEAALSLRNIHFASAEELVALKKGMGKDRLFAVDVQTKTHTHLTHTAKNDHEGTLEYIDKAFALHPKADLLRVKAFLLSEMGRDEEGLKVCDDGITDPPHEETEALTGTSSACAILHKAKAAILADAGRLEEARAALQGAMKQDPNDAEAVRMSAGISTTLAWDYLASKNIPQYLDALVNHVLSEKPADPAGM